MCMAALSGCGFNRRQQGVAELRRVGSAVGDMRIVVSAGVNQQEFSRRLTDSSIKIGDLQQSMNRAFALFPEKDKPTVAEAYQHMAKAMDAYTKSKEFFGDTHTEDLDPFRDHNMFGGSRYESLRREFPNLEELKEGLRQSISGEEVFYWRGDMLEALWKVAAEEDERAKALIDQLAQG